MSMQNRARQPRQEDDDEDEITGEELMIRVIGGVIMLSNKLLFPFQPPQSPEFCHR